MTNPNDYQPADFLPKLTAEMVEGDQTVLTIAEAREASGIYGKYLFIVFAEFPGHAYITNKTQSWALMEASNAKHLPPTVAGWVGSRVPMRKQMNKNPQNGEMVAKLYAMPAVEWPAALAEYDAACAAPVLTKTEKARKARKPRKAK